MAAARVRAWAALSAPWPHPAVAADPRAPESCAVAPPSIARAVPAAAAPMSSGAVGGPAAPGAVSATYDPVLVNGASSPFCAVAPTAMTPGYPAGELTALPVPPLSPAGATSTTSRETAYATAARSAALPSAAPAAAAPIAPGSRG